MNSERPELVILSSPSGAGKSTLARMLKERFPEYEISVSHTTRKPRPGEVHSRDYYFVDDAAFTRMVDERLFAEWAAVHTSRYGTSKAEIERILTSGSSILFDIDWQGTEQLLTVYANAISIFILPPTMRELADRLRGRKSDDEAEIRVRLGNAREELSHFDLYDHLITNDDLNAAFADIESILNTGAPAQQAPTADDVHRLIQEDLT
jgi:guanylate kinase